jgi:Ca2+-binding EF-hand superfamily protein
VEKEKALVFVIFVSLMMTVYMSATVKATYKYDLNADGKVDIKDLAIVAQHFGSCEGHPRWNPVVDYDGDGEVTIRDMVILARHFGEVG